MWGINMMEGEDEELLTSKPNLHQKTIGRVTEKQQFTQWTASIAYNKWCNIRLLKSRTNYFKQLYIYSLQFFRCTYLHTLCIRRVSISSINKKRLHIFKYTSTRI